MLGCSSFSWIDFFGFSWNFKGGVMGLTNKQRVKRTKKAKSSGFFSHVSLSTARFYYLGGDGVVYRDDVYRNCLRTAHLSIEQLLGNPNVLTRSEFKEWLDSRKVA